MKFLPITISLFTAAVIAQNGCGFPDGPDCVSIGDGADGREQFLDDGGCCLLPFRCSNTDDFCVRVDGAAADATGATGNGNGNANGNGNNNGNNGNRNNNNNNNNKRRSARGLLGA